MNCFICHDENGLEPQTLEWDMVDGSHHSIEIMKCKSCIQELDALENYIPHSAISINKPLAVLIGIAPIVFFLGGRI